MGWLGFRRDQTSYFRKKLYRTLHVTVDAVCHGPVDIDRKYLPPYTERPEKLKGLVEDMVSHIPSLVALKDNARTREQVILSQTLDIIDQNAEINDSTESYVGSTSVYFFNNTTLIWKETSPIAQALSGTGSDKSSESVIQRRNLGYFVQFFLLNYHEATFSALRANQLVNHLAKYELALTVRNKLSLLRCERSDLVSANLPLRDDLDNAIQRLASLLKDFRISLIEEEYWVTKKDAYSEIVKQAEKYVDSVSKRMRSK